VQTTVIHLVCNLDDDLVKSIKDSLVEDDEVHEYLSYLRDPSLVQDENFGDNIGKL
jgi:hypothetical protein